MPLLIHHLHWLTKNKELGELYWTMALRSFAVSMISIFVPLYLLQIGFSLSHTLLLFAGWSMSHVFFIIPAAKIASRFGFKHSMSFSMPLFIVHLILLYSFPVLEGGWLAVAIGLSMLFAGCYRGLFFTGYHMHFLQAGDGKKRGSQISFVMILASVAQVLGPVLGGLVITFFGFKILFFLVVCVLLLSMIPLFFSPDGHEPFSVSLKSCFKGQAWKDAIGIAAYGIGGAGSLLIWPIVLFFSVFKEYTDLGLVTSVSLLFTLAFTFYIGRYVDHKPRRVLRWGAIAQSAIWIARAFVQVPMQAYLTDSAFGVARTAVIVPFDAMSYQKAETRAQSVRFIVFREMLLNGGAGLFILGLAAVPNLLAGIWAVAGVSLLLLFF